MFFLRYLSREIEIHPSFFGNNVNERLKTQLFSDLEGSCNGEYYIICIIDVSHISAGRVAPGTGQAQFTIVYRAILWKPFKGEAIDCVVSSIKEQGVFCEAGPLTVFVSKLHLPKDMRFSPDATPPQYSNGAGDTLEKGSAVRVQLIGLRSDVRNMYAVGKMSGAWFGYIATSSISAQVTDMISVFNKGYAQYQSSPNTSQAEMRPVPAPLQMLNSLLNKSKQEQRQGIWLQSAAYLNNAGASEKTMVTNGLGPLYHKNLIGCRVAFPSSKILADLRNLAVRRSASPSEPLSFAQVAFIGLRHSSL